MGELTQQNTPDKDRDFLVILTISTQTQNGALKICFADNGIGIFKKIGDRISAPFFTTN